jgi:hypothetical protein
MDTEYCTLARFVKGLVEKAETGLKERLGSDCDGSRVSSHIVYASCVTPHAATS